MRSFAVVAFAAVVVAAPAGAQPTPRRCVAAEPYVSSWVGRYAWQVRVDERGECTQFLWASENGGRTWHTIYRGAYGALGLVVVRTSRSAGVVFPRRLARTRRPALWTHDNGRHWHRSGAIGSRASELFAVNGRGEHLYWATARALHRVRGWPSHRLRTQAVWRATAQHRILQLNTVPWIVLARVPGGIATIVDSGPTRDPHFELSLLLHRNGATRRLALPDARAALASIGADALSSDNGASVIVRWPEVTVTSSAVRWGRGGGKAIEIGRVVWESPDAGRTWTVHGVR